MTAAPTQTRDPAPSASENTPLLRDEANGSNGSAEANAPAEEPAHEGMPEVLARMHILLPAIGIGVSRALFSNPSPPALVRWETGRTCG